MAGASIRRPGFQKRPMMFRICALSLMISVASGSFLARSASSRAMARRAAISQPVMQMEVRTRLFSCRSCTARIAPAPKLTRAHARPQELEFVIHPDGRVEERVRGVKGIECQSLTEEFNKQLGEVYESKPTQEMFEQKIEISVEAEATVSESWSGSGTWGSGGDDSGGGSQW